jgi:hypothetical protein
MSKTSKQEQVQEIDPQIRSESEALTSLARTVAGLGYQPYRGNTVADFTPAQKAAFAGTDAASAAFGMPTGAAAGGPTGATEGAYGIMGFSPQTVVEKSQPDYANLTQRLQAIFNQAATPAPTRAPHRTGGGKK